jgi:hypothetical protein
MPTASVLAGCPSINMRVKSASYSGILFDFFGLKSQPMKTPVLLKSFLSWLGTLLVFISLAQAGQQPNPSLPYNPNNPAAPNNPTPAQGYTGAQFPSGSTGIPGSTGPGTPTGNLFPSGTTGFTGSTGPTGHPYFNSGPPKQ